MVKVTWRKEQAAAMAAASLSLILSVESATSERFPKSTFVCLASR